MDQVLAPEPLLEKRVVALLEATGALQQGHFVLSSGLHSDRYCQCAALFEHPTYSAEVADLFVAQLPREARPNVVLAPALGGIIWGYELARAFNARSMFAERKPPDDQFSLRRGFALATGDRVLLAEDVVTTGGSVLELVPLVERSGAEVVSIGAVVDRSRTGFRPQSRGRCIPFMALCRLDFPTYPPDTLPAHLASVPFTKPGSRQTTPRDRSVDR